MSDHNNVPFVQDVEIESTVKPTAAISPDPPIPSPTYTYTPQENLITNTTGAVSDTIGVVVGSLVKALGVIFAQGGILIVLIIAALAFSFVYWAIRLIHLRGR